ncbi:hypothetical protein JGI7_00484 [Candidatus Kryptonium thompsonii]|uniref:Outer membrane protein beta-barrel domain-containing protein n=3 Tax=Candidatus Kryptonium thompsonii TaxID=1633631 RepID=A0A0P1ML66_9BACT|nr:hypothetical protein [Candidatus Kryptonium thompsoni]CUS77883.1 hypothetical protein JGI13_00208 [Candidatus Kryptonium thompsoni]CUS79473.1 hypothetical protein JGI8_00323 [Candidatus Kryptonium thompsoni]CUS81099.1 hypothetical protein JGI7_00484 [Candidatus Kryptonium thompsoni]CUS88237.1 hypothetical protein JGI15_104111 [Candidatus Kryptonium thompsoni]CUS91642.1 hypothetical protein JGI14_105212 [Candidatus Kryptonium thompsoni]
MHQVKLKLWLVITILSLILTHTLTTQNLNLKNRNYVCLSAGLGANYINFPDVSDYITSITGKRTKEFDGAPEFWASTEFKIGRDIAIKIDYSYISKQYNIEETSTGVSLNYIFTYKVHNPVLTLNYLLFQEQEIYIVKFGAGLGFTKGYFSQFLPLSGKEVTYGTNGGILKLEAIFSSRLGEKVYVHLSTDVKIGLTDEARDANGNKLIIRKPFEEDRNLRLNFTGVAIRFGFSYYF